jgi:acyl-coenzyme A thioesterase PaaI-like protein
MTDRSLSGPPAPLDEAHEGWTLLPPHSERGLHSFVSGEPDGMRLRVRYFLNDTDGSIIGRAWFGPLAEGPPGHAHGGSMAALLDEAMGAAAWLAGHRVLAAKIAIDFKKPMPLGSSVLLRAWVERAEGRRVFTRGELFIPRDATDLKSGTVYAAGEGLFIAVDIEKLRAFKDGLTGPIG